MKIQNLSRGFIPLDRARKARRLTGFTLLELLVVVSIIGLLASVVMSSLSSSRIKARDARRSQDIRQLQIALELYREANSGLYPANGTGTLASELAGVITPAYISSIPADPTLTGANGYRYRSSTAAHGGYTLMVKFEGDDNMGWCKVVGGSGDLGSNAWANNTTYKYTTDPACDW